MGCGGTRAVLLLFDGSVAGAFWWNPAAVLAVAALAAASFYSLIVLVFRLEPWRPAFLQSRILRAVLLLALVANWVFVIFAGLV